MKLYWFDIPNDSYERTFDSEEYEKDPDNDRFCYSGPFVYWEDHKQALARIAELEQRISDLEDEKSNAYADGYSDGVSSTH